MTPDSTQYDIVDIQQIGSHLLVKANFPNCEACSYEGTKILVYLNTSMKEAIRWKRLDPHFREELGASPQDAPSPDARFPASEEGWLHACQFLNLMREKT